MYKKIQLYLFACITVLSTSFTQYAAPATSAGSGAELSCVYPDAVTATLIDCSTFLYELNVSGGSGSICISYWQIDGTITLPGTLPAYYNLTPGVHIVCAKVYCCDGGDAIWLCTEVTVPEICCDLPTGIATTVISCPDYKYHFEPIGGSGYCIAYWSVDGVELGYDPTFDYVFPGPGTYEVCVKVYCCEGGGEAILVCTTVVVPEVCCELPTEITTTVISCPDFKYHFELADGFGYCLSYWSVDGVEIGYDPTGFDHVFPGPGTYEVCAKVYCCDGNQDAILVCITFVVPDDCPPAAPPGSYYSMEVSGNGAAITLSPNPAVDNLSIRFGETVKVTNIQCLNALGELVLQTGPMGEISSATLPLSSLATGVYFIRVEQGAEFTIHQFIKE